MTMSAPDTDQFRDLLDRWEDLREEGQEPSVEEMCRDAPHLVGKVREWVRVLRMSEWMCRPGDEVADETLGEAGILTAEEKDRHRTLGEYDMLEELGGGGMGRVFKAVHRRLKRQAEGTPFYVMDLVDGEDLARLVREHGAMPVEQAVDCTLRAARGLE